MVWKKVPVSVAVQPKYAVWSEEAARLPPEGW